MKNTKTKFLKHSESKILVHKEQSSLKFQNSQILKKTIVEKIRKNPSLILLKFLGIVFLFAAVFRIFNFQAGVQEFTSIGFPSSLITISVIVAILLELLAGLSLLFHIQTRKVLILIGSFLSLSLVMVFANNASIILGNISELFVFDPTPTDILLHLLYILIIIVLILKEKK